MLTEFLKQEVLSFFNSLYFNSIYIVLFSEKLIFGSLQ